jgi:predicted phosphodiesterase
MKVACLSDLHGHLPEVPDCELLLLAGDYCRDHRDRRFYHGPFRAWLQALRDRGIETVGVGGNHDWVLHDDEAFARSLPWHYLLDETLLYFRRDADEPPLLIYGTPWQSRFFDWAWNLDERELAEKWAAIPEGTDILLLHGPPFGIADLTLRGDRTGSPSLTRRIEAVRPKLVACGHIHECFGMHTFRFGDGTSCPLVNASYVDAAYCPRNVLPPFSF